MAMIIAQGDNAMKIARDDSDLANLNLKIGEGSNRSITITDQEFDAIEKELIRVAPDHPAFRCVESGRKLLSLGNQAPENWLKTLPKNTKLIVQPKIDGVAIALRYVNGKLVKAWTRKGVDKTERIKLVDNIPKNIWNVD